MDLFLANIAVLCFIVAIFLAHNSGTLRKKEQVIWPVDFVLAIAAAISAACILMRRWPLPAYQELSQTQAGQILLCSLPLVLVAVHFIGSKKNGCQNNCCTELPTTIGPASIKELGLFCT